MFKYATAGGDGAKLVESRARIRPATAAQMGPGGKSESPKTPTYEELMEFLQRRFSDLDQRMAEMQKHFQEYKLNSVVKEGYTPLEFGARLGKVRKPETVTDWCRRGRIKAKKVHGQGRQGEWRISHEELLRVEAHGISMEGTFQNETSPV